MRRTQRKALAGYARAVGTKGSVSVLRCGRERWYQNSGPVALGRLPAQIEHIGVVPFLVAFSHR